MLFFFSFPLDILLLHLALDSFVLGIVKKSYRDILLLGVYDPLLRRCEKQILFLLILVTTTCAWQQPWSKIMWQRWTKHNAWCHYKPSSTYNEEMSCTLEDVSWCTGCLPTCVCLCSCCSRGFLCMIWLLLLSSCCLFSKDGLREVSEKGQICPNQWSKRRTLEKACIYHPMAAKFEHNAPVRWLDGITINISN